MACCNELLEAMPAFRRAFLLAVPDPGRKFYRDTLGCYDIDEEREHTIVMTRRAYAQ